MLGWLADLLRLAWGLPYWNLRKTWFQWRRGRSACPCQNPSDSGRAYESGCEACLSWSKPARFRRVCPLLVHTPVGLRCFADAAAVRPFWRLAARQYSVALLAGYVIAVLTVFTFLRTIGYPVSLLHLGLPPLWHKVGQARGWYFLDKSNRALADGRIAEGLLALANAYEYDPMNYEAGIALAKHYQAAHPTRSDFVYQKLIDEHPDKRTATAQDWFRALLARGDFEKVAQLAVTSVLEDSVHAGVWMRALIFSTRRMTDDDTLRELLGNQDPAAAIWHPLLEIELLLRAGRTTEVRAAVLRPWLSDRPPFALFYRVLTLIELRDAYAAVDLLATYPGRLDSEAEVTLRLLAFAAAEAANPLRRQFDELFGARLNPATVKIICAQLIRHPDPEILHRLRTRMVREKMPFNSGTAGAWFSLLCTAGANGEGKRLREITELLKAASKNPFIALSVVESFFRGETTERRITAYLPILPLPIEVTYALLDRYHPALPAETLRRT